MTYVAQGLLLIFPSFEGAAFGIAETYIDLPQCKGAISTY